MDRDFFLMAANERGLSPPHLIAHLDFIQGQMSAEAFQQAKARLHAALCPKFAAHHHQPHEEN